MANAIKAWKGAIEPSMFENTDVPITNLYGNGMRYPLSGPSVPIVTVADSEYVTTNLGYVIPLWRIDAGSAGGRASNQGNIVVFNAVFQEGKRYIISIFGKPGGHSHFQSFLSAYGGTSAGAAWSMHDNTIISTSVEAGIDANYDNGAARYWYAWIHGGADANGNIRVYMMENHSSGTVTRGGNSYIYVGGFQIEQKDEGPPDEYVNTIEGQKTYVPNNVIQLWKGAVEPSERNFIGTPENELIGIYEPNEQITASIVGSTTIGLDGSMPAVVLDSMDIIQTGGPNSETVATVELD